MFLKEKPLYCSTDLNLKKSASFQDYVSSQLEIVPRILKTKNNRFYLDWNERQYFLTEYKKGRHYNGSESDLRAIINSLYDFQQCGSAYFTEYKEVKLDELILVESPTVALGITGLGEKNLSQTEKSILQEILLLYKNLEEEYLTIPREKFIMSHGDFILFNIILDGENVVAINDFDNVKVLPRIHDMAEFLVSASLLNYLAPLTNLKLPISTTPDTRVSQYILQQYRERFVLSQHEINLLGTVTEIVWLWTLVLSVFKGDYNLYDLKPALRTLQNRQVKNLINKFCI